MELKQQENTNRLTESETSLLLDTYMYLNYYDASEGQTLWEIMQDLSGLPDYCSDGIHGKEYEILKVAVTENPDLGKLQISAQSHQLGFDSGTRACLFQEKDTGSVYLVYRGTGDGEWMDNGLGMSLASTPQQERALAYFEEAMEYGNFTESNRIIVTGHSKGGNKAQYVTMESKYSNLIDKCISVDGQGFSEEAIHKWKAAYDAEEYRQRTDKLYGINGENDFVHVLGYSIIPGEHIRYLHTPVGKNNFVGYHDIKYMFATEDQEGGLTFRGRSNDLVSGLQEWGLFARKLSEEIMMMPVEERTGCAAVIMQLMELGGKIKSGLNGEKVTLKNVWDFFQTGIPTVTSAFFFSKEGGRLAGSLYRGGNEPVSIYAVDPGGLIRQAEKLRTIAIKVKKIAEEAEQTEERLKVSMKYGFPYSFGICGKIKRNAEKLYAEAGQFQKMAEILEETAQIYAVCEHAVVSVLTH